MTWADVICEAAAPQAYLAWLDAKLDEVFEDAAQYVDRGVLELTVYRTLPGRIKAIEISGTITI